MSLPIIEIEQGKLQGKTSKDYNGNIYYSFLGIPFAKPPLGELRFKAPQPAEPWEGVLDATVNGSGCYSLDMFTKLPTGSEDCLYLNVFTNSISPSNDSLKPVMVWIYGGSFTAGSNNSNIYGPQFLICEDVVIVSINYRVGVLGFLGLQDQSLGVPGNAGLKDMVLALKWVKNNIQAFNGDPDNVTIFGQSAGGASVHYLMLSPMAKGLFHKAIALSGCARNLWAKGNIGGEDLASAAGSSVKDKEEILKVLRNLTKEELLDAQIKVGDIFIANKERPFGPVVEKVNPYEESFLLDEPKNLIVSGNYNKVPLIMGYVSREGMVFDSYDLDRTDFVKAVPYILNLPEESPLTKEIASQIKEFYYANRNPSSDSSADDFYRLQTDNFHFREIYSSLVDHATSSDNPVYLCRFSAETKLNIFKKALNIKQKGVCHGDDVAYLFKTFLTPKLQPGSLEEITMKRYIKFLTSFAKTGDPNTHDDNELFPVVWKPFTEETSNYVNIDENLTVGSNPEYSRIKFWESIFSMEP